MFEEEEGVETRVSIASAGIFVHLGNDSLTQTPPTEIFTEVNAHTDVASPEFVNYVLALIIYSVR